MIISPGKVRVWNGQKRTDPNNITTVPPIQIPSFISRMEIPKFRTLSLGMAFHNHFLYAWMISSCCHCVYWYTLSSGQRSIVSVNTLLKISGGIRKLPLLSYTRLLQFTCILQEPLKSHDLVTLSGDKFLFISY